MRILKDITIMVAGFAVFFCLMGIAGSYDYADEVIDTMSQEQYDAVVDKLGKGCSTIDIAKEYQDNKEYYDRIY